VDQRMDRVRHELEAAISREVQDKRIPSISYALVDRQGTLASSHITLEGVADAVTDESVFRVGSCSKMFTGIALMQLVEQGRVDIDKDVAEHVPGFSLRNPFAQATPSRSEGLVTLRKLMSHTAGMVREATVGHYLDDSDVSVEEMVEELKTSTLKEDPDAGVFQYSNAGVAVVGYVVQRVSGIDFATYVRENVLDPLGMEHSSFVQTPYIREHLAPACMWTFERDFPAPVFDMGGGGAAGNLFSTVPDMAEFVRTMLRGGFAASGEPVLSTGTLHSMWEPIGRKGKAAYGLTFGLGSLDGWKSVGHGGAVYGYATQLVFLPEAGLGVVLCATLDMVNGLIGRLGTYGLRLALAARGMGRPPDPQPTYRDVSAGQLMSLPGTFFDEASGETVDVVAKDSRLYLVVDELPLRIQARSDTEFAVDGRAFGPGSEYPHLSVVFESAEGGGSPSLTWRGGTWNRIVKRQAEGVPDEFLPFIGEYGPDFNIAYVFYRGGKLKCTIEYFFTHTLEKLSEGVYRMHGLLYDDETLEFDVGDDHGRNGIRVGPMFLARRPASS
jgi:CubicO group peptidase (beta-lactamase class C family)